MELVCVTVDCADPAALARFWSDALGWPPPLVYSNGLGALSHDPEGGPGLEFVRVPEAKAVKNRLHLGCTVGDLTTFDAEFARLVALGASLAWKEVFPDGVDAHYRNWVLRDPEGNEFCLGGGTWPDDVPMPATVPIEQVAEAG